MVEFRGRDADFSGDADVVGKNAKIDAPVETVINSMVSLFMSDEVTAFENFQTSVDVELERADDGSAKVSLVQRFSGVGREHEKEGEERGRLEVKLLNVDDGTRIELTDELIREDNETDQSQLSSEDETEGTEKPIEVVKEMPEKVALGYGPTHPLDDIPPRSVDDLSGVATTVVDKFRPWIAETVRKTHEGKFPGEHGFYVDGAGNVVGVVEGSRQKIKYPPHNTSYTKAKFHTHPKLSSIAAPSEADIYSATSTSVGTVHMLSFSGAQTQFYYDRDEFERARDSLGEEAVPDTAFRPLKSVFVTAYKVIDADRIKDKDNYISNYFDEVRRIMRLNKDFKMDIIEANRNDNQVEAFIRDDVRSTFDSITSMYDKDDNKVKEAIETSIDDRGKALQLSRHSVNIYQR